MRHDFSYQRSTEDSHFSSRSHKKSTGTYYTPEALASLIARDAIFAWISNRCGIKISDIGELEKLKQTKREQVLNDMARITILDPAVGDGIFLSAAGEWLSKIHCALNGDYSEESLKRIITKENLYGVDLAKHAVKSCIQRLSQWSGISRASTLSNFKIGNSLVGLIAEQSNDLDVEGTDAVNWCEMFPEVFSEQQGGFDIILGNPPYGSILGTLERRFISQTYADSVGGGREGTWNSAAHFLVRAVSLMKERGQLGFLVPNSILRVMQFSKTRRFLMSNTRLWKIVDEGSPFEGVTLEMVSLFCEKTKPVNSHRIRVESRRPGLEQSNFVSSSALKNSKVFPIYHDHILKKILERGQKGLLAAGRGRDIPKDHVRKETTSKFNTPYITSGRSVRRYRLIPQHIYYTDDWYEQIPALNDSFSNEFLVATKNYRYPRCILKPKGMIHGGGIVKITPLYNDADLRVLGLILNSKLVKHVSIRYLTNYSQLTCCLNTGIMEEIPIVIPTHSTVYRVLFETLSKLHSDQSKHTYIPPLERLADALVYSLYFGDNDLETMILDREDICEASQEKEILKLVEEKMNFPVVKELEALANFPALCKQRRY